jgi:hypothetical protein
LSIAATAMISPQQEQPNADRSSQSQMGTGPGTGNSQSPNEVKGTGLKPGHSDASSSTCLWVPSAGFPATPIMEADRGRVELAGTETHGDRSKNEYVAVHA